MKRITTITIWLAVIFLGGGHVNCFVHQITETVFEMDLIEMGVDVKEIIEVDLENNLVITTVPQHHNRVAKKAVYDANSNQQLDVIGHDKSCNLFTPYIGIDAHQQLAILHSMVNPPSTSELSTDQHKGPLYVNSESSISIDLISIAGPPLNHQDLPEILKPFCPKNYNIVKTRQINAALGRSVNGSRNHILLNDPLMKKAYPEGSLVDEFPGEELFDSSQKSINVRKRVKRSICRKADFTLTDCIPTQVTCPQGCNMQDAKWDCDNKVYNCQYILWCDPHPVHGRNCLWHIRDGQYGCKPCCTARDCGGGMPECKF